MQVSPLKKHWDTNTITGITKQTTYQTTWKATFGSPLLGTRSDASYPPKITSLLHTQKTRERQPQTLSTTKQYRLHLINNHASYDSIVDDLMNGRLKKIPFFKNQNHWLNKGQPQFIGRVESINTDFAILSRILNIKSKLKRANRSPDKAYLGQFSKSNFRKVVEYYKEDFISTGYSSKHSEF